MQREGAVLSMSFTGSVFGADNSFSSILLCGVRNFYGSLVDLNWNHDATIAEAEHSRDVMWRHIKETARKQPHCFKIIGNKVPLFPNRESVDQQPGGDVN